MDFSNKHELIGTQVQLIVETKETSFGPYIQYRLDDQPFLDLVKSYFGRTCRIKLPGQMFTQDYKVGRINIRINTQGIVEDVYEG